MGVRSVKSDVGVGAPGDHMGLLFHNGPLS